MRVNYQGILNLEKVGFYYLGHLPQHCFMTLAPGHHKGYTAFSTSFLKWGALAAKS